jgi:hypothetical protein
MDLEQIERKLEEQDELIESLGLAIGEFTQKQQVQIKQAIDHIAESLVPIVTKKVLRELEGRD